MRGVVVNPSSQIATPQACAMVALEKRVDGRLRFCIIPQPRGFLPGVSQRKENNHETCGQDVDPDGRFGLHVRGNRDPDTQRRTGPDAIVQSKQSQLLETLDNRD
jgi:hypothetical protein